MALYRCAMCGSSKIVPETKQEGYNTKKGIMGAVFFGGIGALAGTKGNTVTYYHCGACGQVLNHTMLSATKDMIDHCLSGYESLPNIYEADLKRYKQQYFNIEWEEPIGNPVSTKMSVPDMEEPESDSVDTNVQVSDIEEIIIDYLSLRGTPLKFGEFSQKLKGKYESIMDLDDALENLRKRGVLKFEDGGAYALVTDTEERKQLALENAADEMAEEVGYTKDYRPIIKEILSCNSMTKEEIYDYLKQNNHLTEDVIKAGEENIYFPSIFIGNCLLRFVNFGERIVVDPIVCEDDKYRMKTDEEMEQSKAAAEKKAHEKILKEIDTLMPIFETLIIEKKPMDIDDLMSNNESLCNRSRMRLGGILDRLVEAELLKCEADGILEYYSLAISPYEIRNKLYEAMAAEKVSGFSD